MTLIKSSLILCILIVFINKSAASKAGWIHSPNTAKDYFLDARQMNFRDGKNLCALKGGRVVQIESKFENDFVLELLPSSWCFLNAKNPEKKAGKENSKHYVWLDGSEFNYSNWATNRPEINKDAVILNKATGLWYTADYAPKGFIICERAADARLEEIRYTLSNLSNSITEQEDKFNGKLEMFKQILIDKQTANASCPLKAEAVDVRFNAIELKASHLESKIDSNQIKLNAILESVETKIDGLNDKLESLETKMQTKLENMESALNEVKTNSYNLSPKQESNDASIEKLNLKLLDLESSLKQKLDSTKDMFNKVLKVLSNYVV